MSDFNNFSEDGTDGLRQMSAVDNHKQGGL